MAGIRPLTAVVAVAVLVVTGILAWLAADVHRRSEQHLLDLQVRQAAAAVSTGLVSIQPQLLDAMQVEAATRSPADFEHFGAGKVGVKGGFASLSIWQLAPAGPRMLAHVGTEPRLVADHRATAFFAGLRSSTSLQVTRILAGHPPAIGYAELPPGDSAGLVVYAEDDLPSRRRLVIPKSSAFKDLNFALYLGGDRRRADLIESSVPTPVTGERSTASVPFGDTTITLVGTPTGPLGDALSGALPWLIVGVGIALAAASASTVEYVLRRRLVAEQLAADNERLYVQQRNIAETLQRALLADLPTPSTLDVAARYIPGVQGIDVGGDWYDVVHPDERRCTFVVGDVSGRGLTAATTMASLRFAARAYVTQGDGPRAVLAKLDRLLRIEVDQQFATVLVGEVDLDRHHLTLASAGHLPPVVLERGRARLLEVAPGTPIGMGALPRPDQTVVALGPGSTVLAYTDGLVERRGEHLDAGLSRLCGAVAAAWAPATRAGDLVDRVATALLPEGTEDDTVVLGITWPG